MWICKRDLVKITLKFGIKYPDTQFFKVRGLANKPHQGVDIAPKDKESGDIPLLSPVNGKVIAANYHAQYGWQVRIQSSDSDKNYLHLLAHMQNKPLVKLGQIVKKGTQLGIMGSSGCSTGRHCHYEVREPNSLVRIDPIIYLT